MIKALEIIASTIGVAILLVIAGVVYLYRSYDRGDNPFQ